MFADMVPHAVGLQARGQSNGAFGTSGRKRSPQTREAQRHSPCARRSRWDGVGVGARHWRCCERTGAGSAPAQFRSIASF